MISTRKNFFDMLKKSRIIKEIVDFFCSEKTNIDWLIVHKHYLSFLLKMKYCSHIYFYETLCLKIDIDCS